MHTVTDLKMAHYDSYLGLLPDLTPIVGDRIVYFSNNLEVPAEEATALFKAGGAISYLTVDSNTTLKEAILIDAVTAIANIPHATTGGDWDEIDEARDIALNALAIINQIT